MTTTSELRAEIETKGDEISQIAHKIESRFEYYTDWRGLVQERPLVSVGIALGAGLLLSGAAVPLFLIAAKQAGTIARGGATAFLMSFVKARAQTLASQVER
ncbi:MAG TPA: hypothetical protein V6C52_06130 [Coleofasciculaceae cyanobacterium]|jgi:hypothetical protein